MEETGIKTLVEKTVIQLEKEIINGDIAQGEMLPQRSIAERFGVSQIVVRESLRVLQSAGLIEYIPKWGARVISLNLESIREIYLLREALGGVIAREVAEKINGKDLDVLFQLADDLDELFEKDNSDVLNLAERHAEFHMKIFEISKLQMLIDTMKRLNIQHLVFFTSHLVFARKTVKQPASWHRNLVDVFSEKNPDKAEKAMRKHIRKGLADIESSSKKTG